jgi:hypothetical protein
MLYLEHNFGKGAGWIRMFSTTDSVTELQKFRCLVRAPHQAFHKKNGNEDRNFLSLCGSPKDRAVLMIPANLVFETPVERMMWEKTQQDVMKRHPTPFTGIEEGQDDRYGTG